MKRVFFAVVAIAALGLACYGSVRAVGLEPRLEKRMWQDSTMLSLSLDPKTKPHAGNTFDVKIHITPGAGFHVYSADMSPDGGLVPLTVKLPSALDGFFEIVSVKELGEVESHYDSTFSIVVMAHSDPFDEIVTMRAKKNSAAPIPFSLYVYFQTCMQSQCMPARTFAVPMTVRGEKPIDVMIAQASMGQGIVRAHG